MTTLSRLVREDVEEASTSTFKCNASQNSSLFPTLLSVPSFPTRSLRACCFLGCCSGYNSNCPDPFCIVYVYF